MQALQTVLTLKLTWKSGEKSVISDDVCLFSSLVFKTQLQQDLDFFFFCLVSANISTVCLCLSNSCLSLSLFKDIKQCPLRGRK